MFRREKDWSALKDFAVYHNVLQTDLNIVFHRYLMDDEVYLRDFRVKTNDVKSYMKQQSPLVREMIDLLIPFIYMRPVKHLVSSSSAQEVVFARFVILSFNFCNQSLSDCIHDLFCVLRQNMNLKLSAVMYTFNLFQLLKVVCSELKFSASKEYVLSHCNLDNGTEISFLDIIKLAQKYPVMFFSLEKLRRHIRRFLFGDTFWKDRNHFPVSLDDTQPKFRIPKDCKKPRKGSNRQPPVHGYTEEMAVRDTSRAIIQDIAEYPFDKVVGKIGLSLPHDNPQDHNPLTFIDAALATKLAVFVGYKWAKLLIKESGFKYASSVEEAERENEKIATAASAAIAEQMALAKESTGFFKKKTKVLEIAEQDPEVPCILYLAEPEAIDNEKRHYDNKIKEEFYYNDGTGLRAWVRVYTDESGHLLKETSYKTVKSRLVEENQ